MGQRGGLLGLPLQVNRMLPVHHHLRLWTGFSLTLRGALLWTRTSWDVVEACLGWRAPASTAGGGRKSGPQY